MSAWRVIDQKPEPSGLGFQRTGSSARMRANKANKLRGGEYALTSTIAAADAAAGTVGFMKRVMAAVAVGLSLVSAPVAAAAPKPSPTPVPGKPAAGHFKNCSEARAAGVAPMHRGDPNYDPKLDRDNDGIACE